MTRYEWLTIITTALVLSVWHPPSALGWDGNEYLKVPPVARVAYVAGVVDAYINLKATVEAKRSSTPSYVPGSFEGIIGEASSCLTGMPYSQIVAIVDKYVKDHPEKWHHPMADTIFGALWTTCKGSR